VTIYKTLRHQRLIFSSFLCELHFVYFNLYITIFRKEMGRQNVLTEMVINIA
jgi:hypothetical protein